MHSSLPWAIANENDSFNYRIKSKRSAHYAPNKYTFFNLMTARQDILRRINDDHGDEHRQWTERKKQREKSIHHQKELAFSPSLLFRSLFRAERMYKSFIWFSDTNAMKKTIYIKLSPVSLRLASECVIISLHNSFVVHISGCLSPENVRLLVVRSFILFFLIDGYREKEWKTKRT